MLSFGFDVSNGSDKDIIETKKILVWCIQITLSCTTEQLNLDDMEFVMTS